MFRGQAHNAKRADAQRQLAALAAKYSIDTSELPSIAADPSGFARFQAFVTRLSEERAKKKAVRALFEIMMVNMFLLSGFGINLCLCLI